MTSLPQGSAPGRSAEITVFINPINVRCGRYEARLSGAHDVLCISTTPLFAAARKLIAAGYDPLSILVMRRTGSEIYCLRSVLATAAGLTVEETKYGPKLRRWKPLSTPAVAPRTAPDGRVATTLATPAVKGARRKVQILSRSQNLNNPQSSTAEVPTRKQRLISIKQHR
jgi:hypothetical protein